MNVPDATRDQEAAEQREVIAFLSAPGSYGLAEGAAVTPRETHCSIVFLAGDRAYKLKRAISYGALDYTSIAKRERACRAEVQLNRRTAPALYLGVRSINRKAGGALAFEGTGAAVDWVVEMRRFDETKLLDHVVDAGDATVALMQEAGREIARFHRDAEPMPAFGGAAGIQRAIDSNRRELTHYATWLDGEPLEELQAETRAAFESARPLLERRRMSGKVRRCHGDLRLANICLIDGKPTLFDAIEFSDDISCTDVFYDLAFLLMDLRLRHRDDLADAALKAYLDVSGDHEGLALLPLFLAVRAETRSYFLAAGVQSRSGDAAARHLRDARRHLEASAVFLQPEGEGGLVRPGHGV